MQHFLIWLNYDQIAFFWHHISLTYVFLASLVLCVYSMAILGVKQSCFTILPLGSEMHKKVACQNHGFDDFEGQMLIKHWSHTSDKMNEDYWLELMWTIKFKHITFPFDYHFFFISHLEINLNHGSASRNIEHAKIW